MQQQHRRSVIIKPYTVVLAMDQLPERVKAILQGNPSERGRVCSFCRRDEGEPTKDDENHVENSTKFFSCARCHLAPYCSLKCQKDHMADHKHNCTTLLRLSSRLASSSQPCSSVMMRVKLGDALLQMGYNQEQTTPPNSASTTTSPYYYRKALWYYLECLVDESLRRHSGPKVEDRALFLLVVLGGDAQLILDWYSCIGSWKKSMNDDEEESNNSDSNGEDFLATAESQAHISLPLLALHGLLDRDSNPDDCTFAALYLLASLRAWVEHIQTKRAFQAYRDLRDVVNNHSNGDNSNNTLSSTVALLSQLEAVEWHVASFLFGDNGYEYGEILPAEIARIVEHFERHKDSNGSSFLRQLCDAAIQFPLLTRAGTAPRQLLASPNYVFRDCIDSANRAAEFWSLYRQCFASMPEGVELLSDMLPRAEQLPSSNTQSKLQRNLLKAKNKMD